MSSDSRSSFRSLRVGEPSSVAYTVTPRPRAAATWHHPAAFVCPVLTPIVGG